MCFTILKRLRIKSNHKLEQKCSNSGIEKYQVHIYQIALVEIEINIILIIVLNSHISISISLYRYISMSVTIFKSMHISY